MATSDDSSGSSSASSVTGVHQAHEYYEELDTHTLDFRKRKAPTPVRTISFVKEPPPPPAVNPVKEFNEQLNRQFRPDLVPPTPQISLELPAILPAVERAPTPDPVIFDARAKPVQPSKKKNQPSITVKPKPSSRIHHTAAPTTEPAFSTLDMPHRKTTRDEYQVPQGMMLVPVPQQQQSIPMVYSNSFKNNKVAPPPFNQNTQTGNYTLPNNSFQSPSSMISTNPLIQTSYMAQQSQQVTRHMDQSKTFKRKPNQQSTANPTNTNHSFALYNQKNGRIEGVVKNRLNVATNDADGSRITDDEAEPKGKWALWLAQPLCLGLTRLSGIILFGSMILLGAASIAGLIASIALYSQDSVTDAQWKILGMVVCAIMLITIIVTLLIFIYCYKNGYMFNQDEDDIDDTDPSVARDAEGNDRQKAVLRKIYKFNRPNEPPPYPSNNVLQDVSTSSSLSESAVEVNDKQTNTETTIAPLRPKDFDRGVWASINAFGGVSYRPLVPPRMVSRFIQVLPHEIEETYQVPQVIYQVVAPASTVIPSTQIQPRIIQMPAQQSFVEVIEAPKKQPRIVQTPVRQGSFVEVIEPTRKQPRTTIIRQPQTQQIIVQQAPRTEYVDVEEQRPRRVIQQPEYVDVEEQRPRRVIQQPEYVDVEEKRPRRVIQQPEYVDVEEKRPRRVVQQPEYEIVEEIADGSSATSSGSSVEEVVEVVDAPKRMRRNRRQKGKKNNTGQVSVKHIKPR